MYGVQVAAFGITCLVVIVLLLTSPVWMRALTALAARVWKQVDRTDEDVTLVEHKFPREER